MQSGNSANKDRRAIALGPGLHSKPPGDHIPVGGFAISATAVALAFPRSKYRRQAAHPPVAIRADVMNVKATIAMGNSGHKDGIKTRDPAQVPGMRRPGQGGPLVRVLPVWAGWGSGWVGLTNQRWAVGSLRFTGG